MLVDVPAEVVYDPPVIEPDELRTIVPLLVPA